MKLKKLYIKLINLGKDWFKLYLKNISKLMNFSFVFTTIVSIILAITLRPKLVAYLSSNVSEYVGSEYEYFFSNYLVYIPAYFISFLIVNLVSSAIMVLIQSYKKISSDKKRVEFDKGYAEVAYFNISFEDLEEYAKKNGIHDKISNEMWEEYRGAMDSCTIKNYNAKINQKILDVRIKRYNNLLRLYNIIWDLLNK
jgi:hypothetical protein